MLAAGKFNWNQFLNNDPNCPACGNCPAPWVNPATCASDLRTHCNATGPVRLRVSATTQPHPPPHRQLSVRPGRCAAGAWSLLAPPWRCSCATTCRCRFFADIGVRQLLYMWGSAPSHSSAFVNTEGAHPGYAVRHSWLRPQQWLYSKLERYRTARRKLLAAPWQVRIPLDRLERVHVA